MVATIQNKIKTFLSEKTGAEIFFSCLIFLVVIMGIVFRSEGYFNGNISLWLDEAEWVFKLSERPLLTNAVIRPIGFLAATKFLISIANNEITLRLMSYIASIFSIPLIYFIAKEIFRSKLTILLAVFTVSFNPVLINFAKEFKPYSLELFLHMLLIYLLLKYVKLKTTHLLYQIIFISIVILFFAYNIIFLYPSLFLIVLFKVYKEHKYKRIYFLLLTAFLLLGILYTFYYVLWSGRDILSAKIYMGEKYDVFCLSSNFSYHLQWIFKKYLLLMERSGTATIFWGLNFDGYIIIKVALWAFHFIGLAAFGVRRKWEYLLLFVLPILTIILFNIMGLWPFGAFRVNVFMFCYFVIISLYGIDTAINIDNKHIKLAMASLIVTIFILLQFPFGINHYAIKIPGCWTTDSNMRSVLDTISSYELSKNAKTKQNEECILFTDWHSFFPVRYYLWKHSSLSKKYEKFLSNGKLRLYNIRLKCNEVIKSLNKITKSPGLAGKGVWILISKRKCVSEVDQYLSKKNNIIIKEIFRGGHLLIYYQISPVVDTIEAEEMSYHANGRQEGYFWNLWTNGTMSEEVYFHKDDIYRFEIIAKGSLAFGVGPKMKLIIDGNVKYSVFVNSTAPETFIFETEVSEGVHKCEIGFFNDFCDRKTGLDRNLYVDKLIIRDIYLKEPLRQEQSR